MRLLVPLDRSERDGVVLPHCSKLLKALGGSVVLVHALGVARALLPNAIRQAEAYVEAVAAGLQEQGLEVRAFVVRGDPATVLVRLADDLDVDITVMATRRRSGIDKMVFGSVADAVLALSHRPVLLVNGSESRAAGDEKTRMLSAYLATVIWQRHSTGLYTSEEAERRLAALGDQGLDRRVLFETYEAHEREGKDMRWLDIDFQVDALRTYLADEGGVLASTGEHTPSKAA